MLGQLDPSFAGLPGFPDLEDGSENSMELGTLTVEWAIGDHTLTSITGYTQYDYVDICDCDFSALPLAQVDAEEDYDQYSQEIRIASPGGEKLDYIVGFYYHESDLKFRARESFGTPMAAGLLGATPDITPTLTRDFTFKQDQEMWAVFGSTTYSFTDETRLTMGLRYFEESKEASHVLTKNFTDGWDYSGFGLGTYGSTAEEYDRFLAEAAGTGLELIPEGLYGAFLGTFEHNIQDRERDEDDWTGSLTVEHDLTEDTMLFATVATGTKGGGFDARFLRTDAAEFFEYDEEQATSYELGVKTYLLDGAMSLNATAFFATVEDFQVSIFDGATAFFVQNAAEVESKGLEVDLKWAATERLIVGFSGSYLKAEYSEFDNAPCWTLSGSEPVNRGDCVDRGTATARRDAEGDAMNYAPEFAFNFNLDYRAPLGDALEVRTVLNVNYTDEYSLGADNDEIYAWQEEFTKVDMRVSVGSQDGIWDVALIGKNLTDKVTASTANDQPLVPGNGFDSTDRLRSFAIQGTYRF